MSAGQGQKIQKMLAEAGGDLKQLELTVKKKLEKVNEDAIEGEYVTQLMLEGKGWNTAMIEHSKAYARDRGNLRTSEVHGEEEWKIPLKHSFKNIAAAYQSIEYSGSTQVEEHFLLLVLFTFQFFLYVSQDTEGHGLNLELTLGNGADGGTLGFVSAMSPHAKAPEPQCPERFGGGICCQSKGRSFASHPAEQSAWCLDMSVVRMS